jgi:hypothetical protein
MDGYLLSLSLSLSLSIDIVAMCFLAFGQTS